MCRVAGGAGERVLCSREHARRAQGREVDGVLTEQIVELLKTHRGVYSSPRIHAQLHIQGSRCGRKRVISLMQQARLWGPLQNPVPWCQGVVSVLTEPIGA